MYTIILHDINSVDLKNNGSTASKSLTPVARAKWSKTVLFRAVGRLGENETERSFFGDQVRHTRLLSLALPKGWLPQLVLLQDESFQEANLNFFFKNKTYLQ